MQGRFARSQRWTVPPNHFALPNPHAIVTKMRGLRTLSSFFQLPCSALTTRQPPATLRLITLLGDVVPTQAWGILAALRTRHCEGGLR